MSVTRSNLAIIIFEMLKKGLEGASARDLKKLEVDLRGLGAAIQTKRRNLNLSQEALAEGLDVSVSTVKYIEQGRRIPSLAMLLRICWAIDLEYTIGRKR